MLPPSYIASGVFLQKAFSWRYNKLIAIIGFLLSAVLLHAIIDKIVSVVFDGVNYSIHDIIFVFFLVVMLLYSVVLIYIFGKKYWIGILFLLLPEIEYLWWLPAEWMNKEIIFYKRPYIHDAFNYMMDNTIPFHYLNNLASTNILLFYIAFELALPLIILGAYYILVNTRKRKFA